MKHFAKDMIGKSLLKCKQAQNQLRGEVDKLNSFHNCSETFSSVQTKELLQSKRELENA